MGKKAPHRVVLSIVASKIKRKISKTPNLSVIDALGEIIDEESEYGKYAWENEKALSTLEEKVAEKLGVGVKKVPQSTVAKAEKNDSRRRFVPPQFVTIEGKKRKMKFNEDSSYSVYAKEADAVTLGCADDQEIVGNFVNDNEFRFGCALPDDEEEEFEDDE